MNKIVREHYPVENLPEDLRMHFSKGISVTVEIAEESPAIRAPITRPMSAREVAQLIRENLKRRSAVGRSTDEIVAEVRKLRDEWDE